MAHRWLALVFTQEMPTASLTKAINQEDASKKQISPQSFLDSSQICSPPRYSLWNTDFPSLTCVIAGSITLLVVFTRALKEGVTPLLRA